MDTDPAGCCAPRRSVCSPSGSSQSKPQQSRWSSTPPERLPRQQTASRQRRPPSLGLIRWATTKERVQQVPFYLAPVFTWCHHLWLEVSPASAAVRAQLPSQLNQHDYRNAGDTTTSQCCGTHTLCVVPPKEGSGFNARWRAPFKEKPEFLDVFFLSFIHLEAKRKKASKWGKGCLRFSESTLAKPHTPPQEACPSHLFKVREFVLLRSVFTSSCSSSKSSDAYFIVLQCGGGGCGNAAVTSGNHYLHSIFKK